jgi:hypothetical protein
VVLSTAVTINRALAARVEGLPDDAGRIVDPRFLRLGVAAGGLALLYDLAASLARACVDFLQLVRVFDLDVQVIKARRTAARRNREIHPGTIRHALRVVGFNDRGLCGKQG